MQQLPSPSSEDTAGDDHDYTIDFILSILFASLKSFKGESLIKPLPSFVSSVEQLVTCHDETSYPPIGAVNNSVQNHQFIEWAVLLAGQLSVYRFNEHSFQGVT